MTSKSQYATKAVIKRLVDTAKELGLSVGGLEFGPDGTVRILDKSTVEQQPRDEFEEWDAAGKL